MSISTWKHADDREKRGVEEALIAVLEGRGVRLGDLDVLIEHARRNKILLHVLRALNVQNHLREAQENSLKERVRTVQLIAGALRGLDYAFFKLVKPVAYVPADVDLLVRAGQAVQAAKRLISLGFEVAVKDPYCVTLVRGGSVVDLYVHPSLGGAILMDGQRLLEHAGLAEYGGVEVRSLSTYAEALVAAAHAVYKEKLYTLNDYYTVKKWATGETRRLAEELKCEPALEYAMRLNRLVESAGIRVPYRIPAGAWAGLLLRKIFEDGLARSTSVNLVRALASRRAGRLLTSKLTRETY
ncbi:nucleotidyltransferase family protein [Infirmifilum lucidum]|uniref:Nucleotidyltransferase family protein n=1 Tax=Infirmifilum lucidum TaxID=2776706 RepID=A0A7L9FKC9_9CREN|nr:nucleotidyltransferase family protein [Infirmifilum lucidum]QOJ79265.1 nucleotidyltransferase family protein [Infirmifilum lucidum]